MSKSRRFISIGTVPLIVLWVFVEDAGVIRQHRNLRKVEGRERSGKLCRWRTVSGAEDSRAKNRSLAE